MLWLRLVFSYGMTRMSCFAGACVAEGCARKQARVWGCDCYFDRMTGFQDVLAGGGIAGGGRWFWCVGEGEEG